MAARDPNSAGRLVHVCPDIAVAALVSSAARRCGFAYARFDDAFAACLELLRHGGSRTILLVALDSLAKVETGLLTWAWSRCRDLAIWAHGSGNRLNGHLAEARVKLVRLGQIDALLRSRQDEPLDQPTPWPPETRLPEPEPQPAPADPALELEPQPAPPDDQTVTPALQRNLGQKNVAQPPSAVNVAQPPSAVIRPPEADEINLGGQPGQPLQPTKPALRLIPPDSISRPLLTPEELAALLGPEDIHGG